MSRWTELFLGIIALATLVTAIIQITVLVAAGRLARRVTRAVERLEQEVAPAIGHVHAATRDASRAVSLATTQVERADRLFAEVAGSVERTLGTVEAAFVRPAKEGAALFAALRAIVDALRATRAPRGRGRERTDDDDALFI